MKLFEREVEKVHDEVADFAFYVPKVLGIVKETKVNPNKLKLEITECVLASK